jgi:two-component system, NarL family, response regulator NreC
VSNRITIVLAEDHHVVRQGLRVLLEAEPDFAVVGEAADSATAVDMVQRLRPDVLVLDVTMPGVSGFDALRRITKLPASPRVVILTMHSGEPYVVEALKGGASGYVLKEATASDLVHAVREVMAGRRYLSPPLSARAIDAYMRRADAARAGSERALTPRELEVLRLSALGDSVPQIATKLSISSRTVESHRANFMRKLGLRSQTDLVRYAIRQGLVASP